MAIKVTYTDRNKKMHIITIDINQYRHFVTSLVWTKGKVEKVETIA